MADADRQFSWRQGDVIPNETAKALDLLAPLDDDQHLVIVVSHDCDLTAAVAKEPNMEVIVGKRVDRLGVDSFGKTARRLHIEYESRVGPIAVELTANSKKTIPKSAFFAHLPRQDIWLAGRGIRILQRWLASRYERAAFPEAFEGRLRAVVLPGKPFLKRIENILSTAGEHVRALLFNLDEGKDVERKDPTDIYQLGIYVLYDSRDEPTAVRVATKVAEDLEELFEAAFYLQDAGWKNICLQYCNPISDNGITLAEKERLKQWRLEHMSLEADPFQPMISS